MIDTYTRTTAKPRDNILARFWNDPAIRTAVIMFVVLRVVTAITAYWLINYKHPNVDYAKLPIYNVYGEVFTMQGPLRTWFEPWYRWDTGWYLQIAYQGYSAEYSSIIFPPLYPWTIKLLAAVLGDYLVAGIVVSNISCLIMLVLLYKLVASEFSHSVAQLTLLFTITFPAAFYFVAAYSESLFMALVLAAWYSTTKRRYLLAGILAFLASLTRSQGWVLALPLGYIAYVQQLHLPQQFRDYRQNLTPLLQRLPVLLGGVLGTAAYLLGMQLSGLGSVEAAYGNPIWKVEIVMPWESLMRAAQVIIQGTSSADDRANIGAFVFATVLTLVITRKFKPPYWLYLWPTLGFILLRSYAFTQLHGMLRYTLYLFPIFIALAILLDRNTLISRVVRITYIGVGFAIQILLVITFCSWLWVS